MSNDPQFDLKKLCDGDDAEWDSFCEHFTSPLSRFLAWMLTSEVAEEITQVTFYKAYMWFKKQTSIPEFRDSLQAWLMTIARRSALDYLRDQKRQGKLIEGARSTIRECALEQFTPPSDELGMELPHDLLKKLTKLQRRIFIYRFTRDMKFREIAEAMNMSLGTVHRKYREGRDNLRGDSDEQ